MSENTDIYVLELLASKICHDLISPIGAVNNGVEFLQEMGADAGDEVTGLIAYSAQQASAKLQAYRIAYGAGGADDSLKPEDVHKSIESIVSVDGKIKQVWDPYADLGYGDDRPHAFSKLLMCALLFAKDCLPKGGELDVRAGHGDESHIIAKGENAALRDNIDGVMAMHVPTSSLEPKHIHAYVCALLARKYGYEIKCEQVEENSVTITLRFPTNET